MRCPVKKILRSHWFEFRVLIGFVLGVEKCIAQMVILLILHKLLTVQFFFFSNKTNNQLKYQQSPLH